MDERAPTPEAALASRLAADVAGLKAADQALRTGDPEGVHDARVWCRRLRADLTTYRPLLDRAQVDATRTELHWLAGTLSAARDAQVVQERLRVLVEREQLALVVGPVRERLNASAAAALGVAEGDVAAALGSARYVALSAALPGLASDPPWAALPPAEPREVLQERVRRRGRELVARADAAAAAEDRDTALHEARKAAKRLRYAAEGTTAIWGDDVRRVEVAARRLTTLLGEHHDTVICRAALLALAADARVDGDSDFTFGRLHAREQTRAAEIDRGFEELWRRLRQRRRLRAWLG